MYTFVNVFMGCMLGFYQYKINKQSHIFHTGPLNQIQTAPNRTSRGSFSQTPHASVRDEGGNTTDFSLRLLCLNYTHKVQSKDFNIPAWRARLRPQDHQEVYQLKKEKKERTNEKHFGKAFGNPLTRHRRRLLDNRPTWRQSRAGRPGRPDEIINVSQSHLLAFFRLNETAVASAARPLTTTQRPLAPASASPAKLLCN